MAAYLDIGQRAEFLIHLRGWSLHRHRALIEVFGRGILHNAKLKHESLSFGCGEERKAIRVGGNISICTIILLSWDFHMQRQARLFKSYETGQRAAGLYAWESGIGQTYHVA
jgi:hypothetical protein